MKEKEQVNTEWKKNQQLLTIVIVTLSALFLIVSVYAAIYRGPKGIFNHTIHNVFTTMSDTLASSKANENSKGVLEVRAVVKVKNSANQAVADIINPLSLKLNYGVDYQKQLMNLELATTYDSESLLNLNGYFQDQAFYLSLPGLYDGYFVENLDKNTYRELFRHSNEDDHVEEVLEEVIDAVNQSLKSSWFTSSDTRLKVDTQEEKVKQSMLTLSFQERQELIKNVLTTLCDSKTFAKNIAAMTSASEEEVKMDLKDRIDDLKYSVEDNAVTRYSIYTKGLLNEFCGILIENIEGAQNTSLLVVKQSTGKYRYELKDQDGIIVSGKFISSKDDEKEIATSDTKFIMDIPDFGSITFNIGTSTKYNQIITKKNIKNAKTLEQFTDSDMETIMQSLFENKGVQKLMAKLQLPLIPIA